MMYIGTRIALAGIAGAFFIDRARIGLMPRVAHINGAAPRDCLPGAARASRDDAVKHIDATPDRADNVIRPAHTHQVTRLVLRQKRHGCVENAEHFTLSFADREPADGIAVKTDLP